MSFKFIKKIAVPIVISALFTGCGGGDESDVPSCPNSIEIADALAKINRTRSSGRYCGDVFYPATTPLVWNDNLLIAAQQHSTDMSENNYFSHTGSDGSDPFSRMNAAGYYYKSAAENIGAGYTSINDAMTGWINSPGHCANLMGSRYKDYAIACSSKKSTTYGTYWTQVFGSKASN